MCASVRAWSPVSSHSVSALSWLSAFFPSCPEPNRAQQANIWHLLLEWSSNAGAMGVGPGLPFESLCLSGCLVLSNFWPVPAAWMMDPGNRRDTSSPPTGSMERTAHRSPPDCAESECAHLTSVSSSPLSWPHPQKALAQAPAAPPTHSVTLDLSGWPLGMGIREQNIQGRGGSVVQ